MVGLGVADTFVMLKFVLGEEGSNLGSDGGPGPQGVAAAQVGGGLGGESDLIAGVEAQTCEMAVWGRAVEVGFVAGGVVAPHGAAGLVGGDGAELGPEVRGRVGGCLLYTSPSPRDS